MENSSDRHTHKLGIGLCTFKRMPMLRVCLESIFNMVRPEGIDLWVIVADNDPEGSAVKVVEEFQAKNIIPISYAIENQKGIPFARNNVLARAKELGITELAFLDDDEYADPNWLISLWNYYLQHEVDVVWGWVKTIYPDHTPKWIVEGNIHQLPRNKTGKRYYTAYTNNVLFNFQKIVVDYGIHFSEYCGLVGDDEDFFMRAAEKGIIIHFLAEAIVYEPLVDSRMPLKWYLKRIYYTRNNEVLFKDKSLQRRLYVLGSGFLDLLRAGGSFIKALFILKKYAFVITLGYLVAGFAKILGFVGFHRTWN